MKTISDWMKYIKARYKFLNMYALKLKDYDEAFHGSYLHRGRMSNNKKNKYQKINLVN